jgi:hypothetical protein
MASTVAMAGGGSVPTVAGERRTEDGMESFLLCAGWLRAEEASARHGVAPDSLENHRRGRAPVTVAHELVPIANGQQAPVRHPRAGNWNRAFNLGALAFLPSFSDAMVILPSFILTCVFTLVFSKRRESIPLVC